jgi:hypothetical protein
MNPRMLAAVSPITVESIMFLSDCLNLEEDEGDSYVRVFEDNYQSFILHFCLMYARGECRRLGPIPAVRQAYDHMLSGWLAAAQSLEIYIQSFYQLQLTREREL